MDKLVEQFEDFEVGLKKRLKDPEYAKGYLEIAREEYEKDGDREALLLAFQDVAEAQGGISNLAKRIEIDPEHLYNALDVLIISKENIAEPYSTHSKQTTL